jgi:hypothetical protein
MTFAEFEVAFNRVATTPEGVIKCLCVAAYEWIGESNKEGKFVSADSVQHETSNPLFFVFV